MHYISDAISIYPVLALLDTGLHNHFKASWIRFRSSYIFLCCSITFFIDHYTYSTVILDFVNALGPSGRQNVDFKQEQVAFKFVLTVENKVEAKNEVELSNDPRTHASYEAFSYSSCSKQTQ